MVRAVQAGPGGRVLLWTVGHGRREWGSYGGIDIPRIHDGWRLHLPRDRVGPGKRDEMTMTVDRSLAIELASYLAKHVGWRLE